MSERFICDLAWVHMSVMPHGICSICCVADHSLLESRALTSKYETLNISKVKIQDIVNSDSYKKIRLSMLAGQVPPSCSGCHKVEQSGGISKRLKDGSKYNLNHDELTASDGSIAVDLKDVELRIGNYCNLKCRGCNAESSTSWIQDYHKLKSVINLPSAYDHLVRDPSTDYSWCESDEFYNDLLANTKNMMHIHISGGEPFLVPKHFSLLDKLIDNGRTNLGIHYITNLNYDFNKIVPALEKLKKFNYVSISFSIDDVGDRNSYIRSLSDWSLTIKNLKRFLTEYPSFAYSITQTFNAYNFMYCEELYQFLKENDILPKNGIVMNHFHSPEYLTANVLPLSVRRAKLDEIKGSIPDYMYDNLYGRYYNSPDNDQLQYFKYATHRVDLVRNESIAALFPKLIDVIK